MYGSASQTTIRHTSDHTTKSGDVSEKTVMPTKTGLLLKGGTLLEPEEIERMIPKHLTKSQVHVKPRQSSSETLKMTLSEIILKKKIQTKRKISASFKGEVH